MKLFISYMCMLLLLGIEVGVGKAYLDEKDNTMKTLYICSVLYSIITYAILIGNLRKQ